MDPRRLRLQYPGARYLVINRDNYRFEVFETVGAAKAFEGVLGEACKRNRWRIRAYVIVAREFAQRAS